LERNTIRLDDAIESSNRSLELIECLHGRDVELECRADAVAAKVEFLGHHGDMEKAVERCDVD
jgi:hypothetical protein